jgi:threonine-phosphate decarboxylase
MSIYTTSELRNAEETLGKHGGDVYAIARRLRKDVADFIDFSSNTHAFAMPVTDRLVRETPYPHTHYPDSNTEALREAIAAHEGCDASSILTGNGSSELIWLAFRAFEPKRILFIGPMFSEYVRCAMLLGIEYDVVTPPESEDFALGPKELRTVWDSSADLAVLCTPNNPGAITYQNIQEILSVMRIPRVLIDNTYRELLHGWPEYAQNGYEVYRRSAGQGVTVFSMGSFTKFFACPGIRLGYLAGDPGELRHMAKFRPPWMVSPFAETMGIKFLKNIALFREALLPMQRQGQEMAMHFRHGGAFDPDRVFVGASFITAALAGNAPAAHAREKLLRDGLIVRDCDSIPGMPQGYLRMQIRPAGDSGKLIEALAWYGERGWG